MLDIKFIRENSDLIKYGAEKKNMSFDVSELIKVDEERLSLRRVGDDLRAKQNKASEKMASGITAGERQLILDEMKNVKEDLKKVEEKEVEIMKSWHKLMLAVPNIPDVSVPDGKDDADNVEVKKEGVIPTFSFIPLDHIELMEKQDFVDFERGTKTSGFRGYFLKNDGAMLEMAIWQYVMDRWQKKGFTPMLVPSLVKREALLGSGYLPQGEDDLYKDENDYFAGTGEVATMYYHSDEILPNLDEPKKFIVWSPCFRKEAGSHGKDVKGLIRVHEFYKCEQVVLCKASHEESVKFHEEIRLHAEEMME